VSGSLRGNPNQAGRSSEAEGGDEMNILDQLRRDEGEVLHAYEDSLGYLTIGVGHLVDSRKGGQISKEISAAILQEDVTKIVYALRTNLDWWNLLDTARQGVLVNMGFALGFDGLLGFHNMLGFLQLSVASSRDISKSMGQDHFNNAALEIENSKWAAQVGDRAKRLAQQLRSGEWQ
jgi:lysozyme